jgi:S-adenosylmethionine:diacylglycerol 3-amino-3-carboxypropyl transferase
MPKVVLTHAVVDVERWLKGKEERAAAIGAAGTNVTDYVAADGSNNIAVTVDISDMDAAQALMASPPPEIAAQMESHGVIQPVTLYVEA